MPGKADGVIGLDPLVLQCARCALIWTATGATELGNSNAAVVLSGSRFHNCPGGNVWLGRRLCPACFASELVACTTPHGTRRDNKSEPSPRWRPDEKAGRSCFACGLPADAPCSGCRQAQGLDDDELDEFGTPPLPLE